MHSLHLARLGGKQRLRNYSTKCNPTELIFTLPCLNSTEKKYIQYQLSSSSVDVSEDNETLKKMLKKQLQLTTTTNYNKLNKITNDPILLKRFENIALAYDFTEEKNKSEIMKMCTGSTLKTNKRSFVTFRPHEVRSGLEYGILAGNPESWIKISKLNKYRAYEKTLEMFCANEIEFLHNYIHRLKIVMEKLGRKSSVSKRG